MSSEALVMMLVAMLVIWGGLAAAIVNLARSTDAPTAGPTTGAAGGSDPAR